MPYKAWQKGSQIRIKVAVATPSRHPHIFEALSLSQEYKKI